MKREDDDDFEEVGDDLEMPVPVWKTCVALFGLVAVIASIAAAAAARDGVRCAIAWYAENLSAEGAAESGCPELASLAMANFEKNADPEERIVGLLMLACDAKVRKILQNFAHP